MPPCKVRWPEGETASQQWWLLPSGDRMAAIGAGRGSPLSFLPSSLHVGDETILASCSLSSRVARLDRLDLHNAGRGPESVQVARHVSPTRTTLACSNTSGTVAETLVSVSTTLSERQNGIGIVWLDLSTSCLASADRSDPSSSHLDQLQASFRWRLVISFASL